MSNETKTGSYRRQTVDGTTNQLHFSYDVHGLATVATDALKTDFPIGSEDA